MDKRGKKILRVAKRVSGVLLQIIVFELPLTQEEEEEQFQAQLEIERREAQARERAAQQKPSLAGAKPLSKEAAPAATAERPATAGTADENDEEEVDEAGGGLEGVSSRPLRRKRQKLERFFAPSFRIIGYDPRSKVKTTYVVPPPAVTEIAGGSYSLFLEKSKRRELARIVCDGLQCIFEKGNSFQLFLPFSGAVASAVGAPPIEKKSVRASAEQILHRPGKIFRSAMRISNLDLLVTIYVVPPGTTVGSEQYGITCNFYAPIASESVDVFVSGEVQMDYLGNYLIKVNEGLPRAITIRKLCQYFRADIIDDRKNAGAKLLRVDLLPKKSGFIQEYKQIGIPKPGTDIRPVGVPAVFMPPDTCGVLLHRRGAKLFDRRVGKQTEVEFVVSVHTKSALEGPERGVVVKIYDKNVSGTMIIHIGPSEVKRLVDTTGDFDLLRDISTYREMESDTAKDSLEANFESLTEKADNLRKLKSLYDRFSDIIINDIGLRDDPVGEPSLYLRTSKTEPV